MPSRKRAASVPGKTHHSSQTAAPDDWKTGLVPQLQALIDERGSELREVVERFSADREALDRRYPSRYSPARGPVLDRFYEEWAEQVRRLPFESLSAAARVDCLLLRRRVEFLKDDLDRGADRFKPVEPLLPFTAAILTLDETRRQMLPVVPEDAARTLHHVGIEVENLRSRIDRKDLVPSKVTAFHAGAVLSEIQSSLRTWFEHYAGYDPLFTWWTAEPYRSAVESLEAYGRDLREKVLEVRPGEDEPIVGQPLGQDALEADLQREMIAYFPDELVQIAQGEMHWIEERLRQASQEMGCGSDWKAALDRVKDDHLDPGRQCDLCRDLELEGVAFLGQHDLITVPPLAQQVWRMQMMSPERQKVNPFFLGGESLTVSFPTDTMSESEKRSSLRSNNIHFARATVFHEMIPGHHLHQFMTSRYCAYRREFWTSFWLEGTAVYWETLFWDLGFFQTPEDRIGHLFWRMHRAARVVFSIRFHLGEWTPQECIDFLVDRVGHEVASATAEVRRSFNGAYPPLYQAAYQIGCLQFRALRREIVDSGRMTDREFHDFIYMHGFMPVEMVRALLLDRPSGPDDRPSWRFAGEPVDLKRPLKPRTAKSK